MILFPQWSIWVIDDVVITSRELLLPVSDEVVHQVWMVEWMRGLCAGGALGGGGRQMDMWSTQREWFSPLFITHVRVAPRRLMNHFTDVTNTRASSSLGGETTVRIKWAGAFCGAPQMNETRLFGRSYSKKQFTAGRRYRRDRKLSCFLIFLLNSST